MTHPDYLLLSEAQFTGQIRELAALLGWARYHTWLSKHSTAGFPDEVLVRPPRVVYAELKGEKGRVTPAQAEWLTLLSLCGVEVYLWRPSMLEEIVAHLKQLERPALPGPGAWQGQ